MISFDDFCKLDLRIGKILETQVHPYADNLYLLRVDLGEKTIQLVAGIRAFYTPQELRNRAIAVLVNLQPKSIRGCLSEGMLLAAGSKDRISLIGPYEEIETGSKIK